MLSVIVLRYRDMLLLNEGNSNVSRQFETWDTIYICFTAIFFFDLVLNAIFYGKWLFKLRPEYAWETLL